MRKALLVLMVLFAVIGSAVTGAGSFLTMNKFMEGVDYQKIEESKAMIEKAKAEGVDLANNPEYADMVELIANVPSESTVMLTKAIAILSILLAVGLCAMTFKKHQMAVPIAVVLAVASVALFFVTPDLEGGMTAPMPLRKIMTIGVVGLFLTAASGFGAMKKA